MAAGAVDPGVWDEPVVGPVPDPVEDEGQFPFRIKFDNCNGVLQAPRDPH